jgi:hypothetical protein
MPPLLQEMKSEMQHSKYIKDDCYLNSCHPTDSSTCHFRAKMAARGQSTEGRACQATERSCQVQRQTDGGLMWGLIETQAAPQTQGSLNPLLRVPYLRLASQIGTTVVQSRVTMDVTNSLLYDRSE